MLEFDSYAFHATKAALRARPPQDGALQRGRYVVLRTTWRELTKESHALIARTAEALARASATRVLARVSAIVRARAGP